MAPPLTKHFPRHITRTQLRLDGCSDIEQGQAAATGCSAAAHEPVFRRPQVGPDCFIAFHMLCVLQVRGSNAALSSVWNVTSYPTLLAVCNGDPALAERYSGELKSERIASFLVRPLEPSALEEWSARLSA